MAARATFAFCRTLERVSLVTQFLFGKKNDDSMSEPIKDDVDQSKISTAKLSRTPQLLFDLDFR